MVLILLSCNLKKIISSVNNNLEQSFTVSFFSYGNGVDRKSMKQFINHLDKNYSAINYYTIKWGKEGETDICINITEPKSNQINQLEKDIKDLLSNKKNIRVIKNKPCRDHVLNPL